MNDPGLDEPIAGAEGVAEEKFHQHPDSDMDEQEEEDNYLLPAKWWYSSTAFPLAAGTFGPMASAFSICALAESWRVSIPPGGTEGHGTKIQDPKWLIAVNAISLAFALMANLALLLNMAQRLRFSIAQPITIVGFWVASVLLIALVAVANNNFHAPGVQDQALSQAFYYAVFAAGIYQCISYLMCMTVYGAYKGHYSKEFKLTVAQRTLMLQTISFLVYLLLGALVYSTIESWTYLDALYYFNFTCLTIGIGDDYTPHTHLGRSLLFPMAIAGIITLGLVVGSIRSLVLERGKKKMKARMTEKMRGKVVKAVAKAAKQEKTGKSSSKHLPGMNQQTSAILKLDPADDSGTELQRRKAEFDAMRKVQEMAATERKWIALFISVGAAAFLWCIGGLVFWQAEKNQQWSYFEAFYFSYTSLMTIGYGDFQPQSNAGKPFFVFWSLLAIPTLTILISNMGDTVVKAIKDVTIWVGEVTVLPHEEDSGWERMKYGVFKLTLGRVDFKKYSKEDLEQEEDQDFQGFEEMNPGLIKTAPRQDRQKRSGKKNDNDLERMAKDLDMAEQEDENDSRLKGDVVTQNEHRYRHILISEIRRVYVDANRSTPKQYSYAEWAYFLRLLGEDESDSSFHKRPPAKTKHEKKQANNADDKNQQAADAKEELSEGPEIGEKTDARGVGQEPVVKWSWMGSQSPLMGDKDEPEWVLQKLFERLEEDLRRQWKQNEKTKNGEGNAQREGEREEVAEKHVERGKDAGRDEKEVSGEKGADNAEKVAQHAEKGGAGLARGDFESSGTSGTDDEVTEAK